MNTFQGDVTDISAKTSPLGAGMVYLEPHQLGWEPLLTSWLATLPTALGSDMVQLTERLFKWMLPACLRFVRREVKEQSPTEDITLACNTMRLVLSLLDEFQPVGSDEGEEGESKPGKYQYFLYSKVNTVGSLIIESLWVQNEYLQGHSGL